MVLRTRLLGLACAAALLNLNRYLAYFRPYYALYETLGTGVQRLSISLWGMLPSAATPCTQGTRAWPQTGHHHDVDIRKSAHGFSECL